MTTMVVDIRGRELPGRRCGPSPDGGSYDNIHVGIVHRADTIELVPGDAPSARWQLEVTVRRGDDGTLDFGGPFVHGKRGERHLGLRWGTVGGDGTFTVFRGAMLRFADVNALVLQQVLSSGGRLVGSLGLTAMCQCPATGDQLVSRHGVMPPDGKAEGRDGRSTCRSHSRAEHGLRADWMRSPAE